MLRSWPSTYRILSPLSSHFNKQTVKGGDNIGLVWGIFYTRKQCQFENETVILMKTLGELRMRGTSNGWAGRARARGECQFVALERSRFRLTPLLLFRLAQFISR